jgi:hypothetical protein
MVFGLFSKEKALKRAIEKASNKLAPQQDRWQAMEKLRDEGSDEALYGLCRRFGIISDKSVEDEQEKNWVVDALVAKGEAALPPLRRYMLSARQIAFPLKILERIVDRNQVLEVVDEIFAAEKPGYTRDPERRIDLIRWLAEWKPASSAEVVSRIAPYLADFDENARYATIDGLAHHDMALAGPPLLAAMLRPEEESGRIKRRIGEILSEKKVPLGGNVDAIKAILSGTLSSFAIQGAVLVAR